MADFLLISRADGGLSVIQLLTAASSSAELAKWQANADPSWLPVVTTRVVTDPAFPDRSSVQGTFIANRAAWYDNGTAIAINATRLSTLESAAYSAFKNSSVTCFSDKLNTLSRVSRAAALVTLDRINELREQIVGVATVTIDPPSIANGAGTTSAAITVTGALFGDCVDVCAPYDLQGLTATAYVTAADTVKVRLHNGTGGAVNLASGTWKVVVRRHVAMPDYQPSDIKTAITNKINSTASD